MIGSTLGNNISSLESMICLWEDVVYNTERLLVWWCSKCAVCSWLMKQSTSPVAKTPIALIFSNLISCVPWSVCVKQNGLPVLGNSFYVSNVTKNLQYLMIRNPLSWWADIPCMWQYLYTLLLWHLTEFTMQEAVCWRLQLSWRPDHRSYNRRMHSCWSLCLPAWWFGISSWFQRS